MSRSNSPPEMMPSFNGQNGGNITPPLRSASFSDRSRSEPTNSSDSEASDEEAPSSLASPTEKSSAPTTHPTDSSPDIHQHHQPHQHHQHHQHPKQSLPAPIPPHARPASPHIPLPVLSPSPPLETRHHSVPTSTRRHHANRPPTAVSVTDEVQVHITSVPPPPARPESDVANWAPQTQVPVPSGPAVPQLPDLFARDGSGSGHGRVSPTSFNFPEFHLSPMQLEMSLSINALLSEQVFAELLADSLGRHRFREYLQYVNGDVASLDLWCDLRAYRSMTDRVKTTALALHDIFSMGTGHGRGALSTELREDVLSSLRQGVLVGDSLDLPQSALLASLYRNEFQSFVKHKLIEHASVRLGMTNLSADEKQGLGFERLTGYQGKFIVGRNCRMLAGPATNPATSKRISTALHRGEGINTLLLNYKKSGEPFWNLLCIIPLRGLTGELTYFIGGQTEVTGTLAAGSNLSFLVGSDNDPSPPIDIANDFSPSLRAYTAAIAVSSSSRDLRMAALNGLGGFGPSRPTEFAGAPTAPSKVPLAGGQARVGRQNEFRGSGGSERKGGLRGFWEVVSGKSGRGSQSGHGHGERAEDQMFAGAEALFDREARPVEIQIASFASVYSKVVIFRRRNREVLFLTSEFLAFCGLSHISTSDIYRSPLIHSDLLGLIAAPQGEDPKVHRRKIKDAVARGISLSLAVDIKMQSRRVNLNYVFG
ncbi:hypothetical protein MNV49_001054 [Pseudohyphozyma bogoriensis]|nr:hypothetical protein MNV49_001054 [Pseudohyphozyma bogoriensis]